MQSDDFEWDDAKAAANLRKYGIAFDEARRVFDDPFCYYDEDTNGRIISARKATRYEQQRYHQG